MPATITNSGCGDDPVAAMVASNGLRARAFAGHQPAQQAEADQRQPDHRAHAARRRCAGCGAAGGRALRRRGRAAAGSGCARAFLACAGAPPATPPATVRARRRPRPAPTGSRGPPPRRSRAGRRPGDGTQRVDRRQSGRIVGVRQRAAGMCSSPPRHIWRAASARSVSRAACARSGHPGVCRRRSRAPAGRRAGRARPRNGRARRSARRAPGEPGDVAAEAGAELQQVGAWIAVDEAAGEVADDDRGRQRARAIDRQRIELLHGDRQAPATRTRSARTSPRRHRPCSGTARPDRRRATREHDVVAERQLVGRDRRDAVRQHQPERTARVDVRPRRALRQPRIAQPRDRGQLGALRLAAMATVIAGSAC